MEEGNPGRQKMRYWRPITKCLVLQRWQRTERSGASLYSRKPPPQNLYSKTTLARPPWWSPWWTLPSWLLLPPPFLPLIPITSSILWEKNRRILHLLPFSVTSHSLPFFSTNLLHFAPSLPFLHCCPLSTLCLPTVTLHVLIYPLQYCRQASSIFLSIILFTSPIYTAPTFSRALYRHCLSLSLYLQRDYSCIYSKAPFYTFNLSTGTHPYHYSLILDNWGRGVMQSTWWLLSNHSTYVSVENGH